MDQISDLDIYLFTEDEIRGGASSGEQGHPCSITKKGLESRVKGRNCGFLPLLFFQIWAFRTLYSPKGHVFLEFTLCAATARNKWLEKTLGVAPINHGYAKSNAHLSDDYDPSIWIHP